MKKALILGTNAGQADIIDYLNNNGWETHSCGHKRIGPGCDLAHYFHLVDTLNKNEVKKLAKNIQADIVYSVSSDTAITTATYVSEEMELPTLLGTKIIDLFNSKNQFREFLNQNDIGHVNYTTVSGDNPSFTWEFFPCVVKPTDSQGQRGVALIEDENQLLDAVNKAIEVSTSKTAIIEEYLEGDEFSVNVIVEGGKVIINEFSDRLVFGNDTFGLPKGHQIPALTINEEQIEIVNTYILKIVEKLNIVNGVMYLQLKLKNGIPKIIEIAPRLDGCHIWRLIDHVRGFDLREYVINILTNVPNKKITVKENDFKAGVLEFHHIESNEKFETSKLKIHSNPVYNEFRYSDGEDIVPINGKLEVVGYYIYNLKE